MRNFAEKAIWIIVGLIAAIAVVGVVSAVLFGRNGYYGYYGMMGGYPFYGMYIIMPLMAALSIIVVLLFLYFIAGLFRGTGHYSYEDNRAEEILKERYARGEITQEEFNKMMENIRSH